MNRYDTMLEQLAVPAGTGTFDVELPGDMTLTGVTKTDLLRYLLDCNACLGTAELAKAAGLTSRQVWGLLKSRLASGEVLFKDELWSLNPDFEQPVVAAVRLLRSRGWTVEPPGVPADPINVGRTS